MKEPFLLVLLFLPLIIFPQEKNYDFEHLSTKDGLSQNFVKSITQDQYGFIWFGADNGLNRYDGYGIEVFYAEGTPSNGLRSSTIHKLLSIGNEVWVGTNNGISVFNTELESFSIIKPSLDTINGGKQVVDLLQINDNEVLVAYFSDGIEVIEIDSKEVARSYSFQEKPPFKIKGDFNRTTTLLPDGNILVSTNSGLDVIGASKKALGIKKVTNQYPWINEIGSKTTCFYVSKNKKELWIGTEINGIYWVDLETNAIKSINKSNSALEYDHILSFHEDANGTVWIGSEALYFVEKGSNQLVLYNNYKNELQSIVKNPIYDIFEDQQGNLWFGTFRLGVFKYNTQAKEYFKRYKVNSNNRNVNTEILSFLEDDRGKIWVGTDGTGLYTFDKQKKALLKERSIDSVNGRVVKVLHQSSDGIIWMGTWGQGLLRYNPKTKAFKKFHPSEQNFPSIHVWDILEDNKGNLWLSTLGDGLCYFNVETESVVRYANIASDSLSLGNNDVMAMKMDDIGNLWVGRTDGLDIVYKNEKGFHTVEYSAKGSSVLTMLPESGGRMWVGVNGDGLYLIKSDKTIEKHLTVADGLPSNAVMAIERESANFLWISTYKGLVKYDRKANRLIVPKENKGEEYIARSSVRLKNKGFLFGGIKGFSYFFSDSIDLVSENVNPYFTNLKIFNQEILPGMRYDEKEILTKSIVESKEIQLPPSAFSFTINFSCLLYNGQNNVKYAYFLEGLNQEWQYTDSERPYVHYSNLSPGTYTLRLKASLDNLNWEGLERELVIVVYPPWYQSMVFRIFLVLLLLAVVLIFIQVRVGFLEKQKHFLKKEVIKQTKRLKEQNELLLTKNNEIETRNEEIKALVVEVNEQKGKLEKKNVDLERINEELEAQRDDLNTKSIDLEKVKQELQLTNLGLEEKVDLRTAKLNAALTELETFLYRASHDLRGPISTMLGLLQIAKNEENVETFKVYNDLFENSTLVLQRTLKNLLTVYSIQNQEIQPTGLTGDQIKRLIFDSLVSIPVYREKDLILKIDDNLVVHTDAELLNIILIHLIENAFTFSNLADNPAVVVEMYSKENGQVEIKVEDYGEGINESIHGQIFKMFFRGNERSEGNGLGLYLVEKAVQKLQGSVRFTSAIGSGTSFYVEV